MPRRSPVTYSTSPHLERPELPVHLSTGADSHSPVKVSVNLVLVSYTILVLLGWEPCILPDLHLRRRTIQKHHLRHPQRRGRPEERVPEALGCEGLHGTEDSEPA